VSIASIVTGAGIAHVPRWRLACNTSATVLLRSARYAALMFRVISCVLLIVSGCAVAPPARTVTKVVTVKTPGPTCTTTIRPIDNAELCREHRYCTRGPKMTCAEAYYRLTQCANVPNKTDNHAWLDGGIEGAARNGIPCEDTADPPCGKDAKQMTAAIASKPFSPPMRRDTACQPAS
jgi:hypothetical protein